MSQITSVPSTTRYFMCPVCFNVISLDVSMTIKNNSKETVDIYNGFDNIISPICRKHIVDEEFDEEEYMFEIDKGMIPIIQKLNKKGWTTSFCCEGHVYPGYVGMSIDEAIDKGCIYDSIPYITFNHNEIINNIENQIIKNIGTHITFGRDSEIKFMVSRLVSRLIYNDKTLTFGEVRDKFPLRIPTIMEDFIEEHKDCKGVTKVPDGWKLEQEYYCTDDGCTITDPGGVFSCIDDYSVEESLLCIRYDCKDKIEHDKSYEEYARSIIDVFSGKENYLKNLEHWVDSLPDFTKIYTKDDLFKAFDL